MKKFNAENPIFDDITTPTPVIVVEKSSKRTDL